MDRRSRSPSVAAAALADGAVDWWENSSPDLARVLAANPDLAVEDTDPLGNMGLLRFNRHCQLNLGRAKRVGAGCAITRPRRPTSIGSPHWFAASARKIRSVEREMRWR